MIMGASGSRVAFLVAKEGIEQVELTEPWQAVEQAGGQPTLVSEEAGSVQGFHHLDKADTFPVDRTTDQTNAADYTALVLPGGVANGDFVRTQPEAVRLVASFAAAGKPIAVICHGGWVLIEAGVVSGRQLTSWPSMRTDYRNAGADWVDEEVVVDHGSFPLISSRKPDDLPAFCRELISVLEKA
jgi:protease I